METEDILKRQIIEGIKACKFSILAAEVTDRANKEQMALLFAIWTKTTRFKKQFVKFTH